MCCENITFVKASVLYLVDPVIESGHQDTLSVTAKTRNEAGNTMHLPDTGRVLTVQGTARVTLWDVNKKQFIYQLSYIVLKSVEYILLFYM